MLIDSLNRPDIAMDWLFYCFPEGRHKALTLSFDDGRLADRRLVEIFNRHGIKATFCLNSGRFGREDRVPAAEVRALYHGHEVAAHSLTHPTLNRCPAEMIVQQVTEDRRRLEAVMEAPVRGFAYPNGVWSAEIETLLPRLGIAYARTTQESGNFDMPQDFMRWPVTCRHDNSLMAQLEKFLAAEKAHLFNLFSVFGHSWEFDRDSNWHLIEAFCAAAGGRDEIWYASNIDIVDYMQALKALRFTMACDRVFNPSACPVWLSLDGQIVKVAPGALVELPG